MAKSTPTFLTQGLCLTIRWSHLERPPPGTQPTRDTRWAHLCLPLAPMGLARVHGESGPCPLGVASCRWVGSAGCPAGGPRTQGMGRGQHAMESPGLSPPHSQGTRKRKGMGWM